VREESGATLIELMVVVGIMAIAALTFTLNLRPAEAPLQTATRLTEGFILQARSTAIATTSAYRVVPSDDDTLIVEYADDCDDATWTTEPHTVLDLPDTVSMTATDWSVCFSRRGISSSNVVVTLTDSELDSSQIEVLLGGGIQVVS